MRTIDVNFILLLLVLLLIIPVLYFEETVGNVLTGHAISNPQELQSSVNTFAIDFPLTSLSENGAHFCVKIEDHSYDVVNTHGQFTVTEISLCDSFSDFIIQFDTLDHFNALLNAPSCQNFFTQNGFTYANTKYWDGDYLCDDSFTQRYCYGVQLCEKEATAPDSLLNCCSEELSPANTSTSSQFPDNTPANLLSQTSQSQSQNPTQSESSSKPQDSQPRSSGFINRSVTNDVVGKAASLKPSPFSTTLSYVAYVIGAVFLIGAAVGTVHHRNKRKMQRKSTAIKISLWARKSRQLGYTPDQIKTVLRRRNVEEQTINESLMMAFGKR